ncbi:MAG: diguanylate cyclase [Desulfuromonadales bacterium]|nr:diguanylate cyclase [Desulfuromonadales bacterium]
MKFRIKRKINPLALFYLKISLVISLVILAVYAGIYQRNNRLLLDALRQQAASYYDLIVRVRHWNAGYGGVYVEKKIGMEANPYLQEVGVEAEKETVDGTLLLLKTPAMMTREISTILSDVNKIQFRITSLQLLNQENAPDAFEQRALEKFVDGEDEFWKLESRDSGPVFRYMAPLFFEQSCDKCHFNFNYNPGDVRGGISVTIPFSPTAAVMNDNRLTIISLSFLTLTLLLGSTYIMLNTLGNKLDTVQGALLEASIRDELTGLHNRRYLMTRFNEEFERARRKGTTLGLLMMDIDHFKVVNDNYGHPAGDEVLRSVGQILASMLRDYDVGGRYGGEEFAVVLAETTPADMVRLAERIREVIETREDHGNATGIHITISIGVAVLNDTDTTETLLQRADSALYRAKDEGRNRTVLV